ncbi:unnamed protein product, partial [Rotaria magnacalcarata]
MTRKWLAQLDEEKVRLQKELDQNLADMERLRRKKSQDDEQVIIRRMKDECDQALARQWKLANEQINLVMQIRRLIHHTFS